MARPMFRRLFSKNKQSSQFDEERRKRRRITPRNGSSVLIVDDSSTVRFVMSKMLHESGYRVLEAGDGEAGMKKASKYQPDIIFMDVVMPGINGFEATRKLRKNVDTQDIPIVIISGNKQAVEQFWATKIGANDYMEKPFDRRELFYRLEKNLYRKKEVA